MANPNKAAITPTMWERVARREFDNFAEYTKYTNEQKQNGLICKTKRAGTKRIVFVYRKL